LISSDHFGDPEHMRTIAHWLSRRQENSKTKCRRIPWRQSHSLQKNGKGLSI